MEKEITDLFIKRKRAVVGRNCLKRLKILVLKLCIPLRGNSVSILFISSNWLGNF